MATLTMQYTGCSGRNESLSFGRPASFRKQGVAFYLNICHFFSSRGKQRCLSLALPPFEQRSRPGQRIGLEMVGNCYSVEPSSRGKDRNHRPRMKRGIGMPMVGLFMESRAKDCNAWHKRSVCMKAMGRDQQSGQQDDSIPPQTGNKGMVAPLELQEEAQTHKSGLKYNGTFLLLLLNLSIYVADHLLHLPVVRYLYLYHLHPRWYQFVTATFCHANWSHLSGNLFFVYMFGKLVEEVEGPFGVLATYIITGVGANLFSWLLLPSSMVSVGASGAVFGLFAVSVLVRLSWNWRKLLEVVILGQFVIEKITSEAQASASMGNIVWAGTPQVNHVAHLAGAFIGAVLIWMLTRLPGNEEVKKSR